MTIARTLEDFLNAHNLAYESIEHAHTESSQRNAAAAHLPGSKVAKSVLLKDENGYLLAVLSATRRVHLGQLHRSLKRHVGLATEEEVANVFNDCAKGAVPPTGLLYDVDTVIDDSLLQQEDVYFEAGDHEHLIHMHQKDFRKLLGDTTHSHFAFVS